ncbi:efflux RND transporter periplasmic adaptor subunit [Crocosphaera sp.]|uniref:efflux RND transporter periplasmic adaptor subunit n=1 Tax=Crocosphaera sp. TaxID=2729996 RepID=UPI003F246CCC|nr:efflux RND transporter periplasmic adaptor subunit [Crocosphaera sp.]
MRTVLIKIALISLFIGITALLTVKILLPSFNDPNSRIYSSSWGYPARQRTKGEPIMVKTASVAMTPLVDTLAAPGEAVPLAEINIDPQLKGIVAEIYVTEGERVKKGQPFLKLEPSDFEAKVNLARNNLEIAQVQLELLKTSAKGRLQKLEKTVMVAENQLDEAELKIKQIQEMMPQPTAENLEKSQKQVPLVRKVLEETKQLINKIHPTQDKLSLNQVQITQQIEKGRLGVINRQLQLETALRDLERTVIYAPSDGLVSKVNINVGELAYPGNKLPVVTINQNVTFKAYIDQARLNTLDVGDRAIVRLRSYPGQTFSGKVIKINPIVETTANYRYKLGINKQYTYSVWIEIDNLNLTSGVQGYAQFNLVQNSLTIPESSVTHLSAGEGMVMVLESGHAVVKNVRVGRKFGDQRQVLAGLEIGEIVIIHPRSINPGDLLVSSEV